MSEESFDDFDEFLDQAMNAIADKMPEAEQAIIEAAAALIPKATPMRNGYPR